MGSSIQRFIIIIVLTFLVAVSFFFSRSIVKQVLAGCNGTIQCGDTGYFCSGDSITSCTIPGEPCPGNNGTCQWLCNINLGSQMDCAGWVNPLTQVACEDATHNIPSYACAEYCNTEAENPCTWYVPCTCTDWVDGACDDGDCTPTERRQNRTCDPETCSNRTQCVEDSTCQANTPSCSLSLTPATDNISTGATSTFTASLSNIQNGTVSNVTFSSNNTSVATVNPASDSSSPYNSIITGVSSGTATITANGIMDGSSRCSDTSVVTVPTPSCTISLTPATANVTIGGTQVLTATTTLIGGGVISRINFTKDNTNVSISPTVDNVSPFSPTETTATALSTGTTIVTAKATLTNGATCSDTSTITIPTPACTLSLTPATKTLLIDGTQIFTANTTITGGGVISRVNFTKDNTNVNISPTLYNTPPLSPVTTTATALTPGSAIVTAKATLTNNATCSDTSTITIPVPTCTLTSFSPLADPINIKVGRTQDITPSISVTNNGTIKNLTYISNNTNIATVTSPATITPYKTTATAVSEGSTFITANVYLNETAGIICTGTKNLNITPADAWWQVKNGDVTTNGDINSDVFPAGTQFILQGSGGYPGIPIYGGSLGVGVGTISSKLWNANTTTSQEKLFDYSYFNSLIPEDVTPTVATDASLRSTGFTKNGYEWFKSDGNLIIEIDSNINFAGRKVILLVNGNLTIRSNINLTDGVGFFGTFVSGNISLNPAVTELEGIYLANGIFNTNIGNKAFWARGSVASYGGVTLGRNLTNNSSPAETFEYGPDQVKLFPEILSQRKTKWVEVAP